MKMDITKEKYNPFLKRKELIIDIENPEEPTPSKQGLQLLLAKEIEKDAEHIEVLDIQPGRGFPKATAHVFVWDEKKVKKEEEKKGKATDKAEAATEKSDSPTKKVE